LVYNQPICVIPILYIVRTFAVEMRKVLLLSLMIAANGFAQGVIDVHSHLITPEFVSALENAQWLFRQTTEKPSAENASQNRIVRIAEIEVYPQYLKEYLAFANEVDRLSIEREPGVICLFPMQSAKDSCQIRILEIYASEEAYQQHLKTDHFQKYKQGTLHMVKDLKLPTMKPLDPETMKLIFKKQR